MSDEFEEGVVFCIKKLRDLQDKFMHTRIWSHSNDIKFAPVELSDYLVIEYKKFRKESKGNEQKEKT